MNAWTKVLAASTDNERAIILSAALCTDN